MHDMERKILSVEATLTVGEAMQYLGKNQDFVKEALPVAKVMHDNERKCSLLKKL